MGLEGVGQGLDLEVLTRQIVARQLFCSADTGSLATSASISVSSSGGSLLKSTGAASAEAGNSSAGAVPTEAGASTAAGLALGLSRATISGVPWVCAICSAFMLSPVPTKAASYVFLYTNRSLVVRLLKSEE